MDVYTYLGSTPAPVFTRDNSVRWIDEASQFAKADYLQAALVCSILIWTTSSARRTLESRAATEVRVSQVRLPYELCAQAMRALALGFMITTAVDTDGQWLNVLATGYIFVLGLLRLAINDLQWRHASLLQVNLLLMGSFLLLLVAEVLPKIKLHSSYELQSMVLGAIISLGLAIAVAMVTPREWRPPPADLDVHLPHPLKPTLPTSMARGLVISQ